MTNVIIKQATMHHINMVKDDFNDIDIEECLLAANMTPFESISSQIGANNNTKVALINNKPVAFFGAAELNWFLKSASPWLLTTTHISKFKKTFLRATKQYFPEYFGKYSYLENYTLDKNIWSIRWLGWAGFQIHPPQEFRGSLWRRFSMEAK